MSIYVLVFVGTKEEKVQRCEMQCETVQATFVHVQIHCYAFLSHGFHVCA